MSEMPEKWVMDKSTLPCLFPRVAVRKVARNDDQRTLRPALIPPQVFLNNTLIYFLWPEGEPEDEAYLLGVLNTILADWYARRFVETHLTFQVIKTQYHKASSASCFCGPEFCVEAVVLDGLDERITDGSTRAVAVGGGQPPTRQRRHSLRWLARSVVSGGIGRQVADSRGRPDAPRGPSTQLVESY